MNETRLEPIAWAGRARCYVLRAGPPPAQTTFVTHPEASLQVGHVVHAQGDAVAPHAHVPLSRESTGTCEVLLVQQGRCTMDLFDDLGELKASRELRTGDLVVLLDCGHGFRMLEDTVLLEVKQGPYLGPREKVHF